MYNLILYFGAIIYIIYILTFQHSMINGHLFQFGQTILFGGPVQVLLFPHPELRVRNKIFCPGRLVNLEIWVLVCSLVGPYFY